MITDAHFETLRRIREESAGLRLVCIASSSAGSMLHMAYDRDLSQPPSPSETALLGKLKIIK